MKKKKTLWIAKGQNPEYGTVYLTNYVGATEDEVFDKIWKIGQAQGSRKKPADIAKRLGWEVVEVEFAEVRRSGIVDTSKLRELKKGKNR